LGKNVEEEFMNLRRNKWCCARMSEVVLKWVKLCWNVRRYAQISELEFENLRRNE